MPATLSTPAIWYEANAACGDELVRLGFVLLAVGMALPFIGGLPELAYVVICLAVFLIGSVRATLRGLRVAKRLSQAAPGERAGTA